jgi:hypothetical protein
MKFTENVSIMSYLYDVIEAYRTVSKIDPKQIKESIKVVMDVVDAVNSVHYLESRVGNVRLNEVYIPTWASSFIYPERVSLMTNFEAEDLVKRPGIVDGWSYDEMVIRKAAHSIAGTQKIVPDMKVVSELRKEVTLNDVVFAIEGDVIDKTGEGAIPVPLVGELKQYLGGWNSTEEDIMRKWFLRRKSFDVK